MCSTAFTSVGVPTNSEAVQILNMLPYETVPLDERTNSRLLNYFKGERTGFCHVGPEKWLLPVSFQQQGEHFHNMEVKKDDIFLVTFPRSGTTVTQELTWMINNNLDYRKSSEIPLYDRFPFLDLDILTHDELASEIRELNRDGLVRGILNGWKTPGYQMAEKLASPRHFKTHLPFPLLPKTLLDTSKVIYVARNPKDVAISYYHHNKLFRLHDFNGTFEEYWNLFKNDLVIYAPYWKHIEDAWSRRNNPNLLFLFYEEMSKDLKNVIRKVATFLNKTLYESDVDELYNHLQVENFRKNVTVHAHVEVKGWENHNSEGFIRKGAARDKSEFTEELQKDADEWFKSNVSRNNISFPLL